MAPPLRTLLERLEAARATGDVSLGSRLSWDLVERFPEARARGTLWVSRFRSLAGDTHEALATLVAGLEAGLWWAPGALETEPDLAPVRALPGFAEVLGASTTLWAEASEGASVDVVARAPDGAGPFPLLVVFHVGSVAGSAIEEVWFSATVHGVAVALVGSPSPASSDPGSRTWSEPMRTEADVGEALGRVSSLVAYDDRIAFAGWGDSGRVAAQLTLRGRPAATVGFAVVSPAPFDAGNEPLSAAGARGTRAWVAADPVGLGWRVASELVTDLERAGLETVLERIREPGDEAPADLPSRLPGALAFLFDR